MKVEIRSFAEAGELTKERLILKASSDLDIGDYAVFCSGISDEGNPTSGRKRAFWFPDYAVKAGDLVVLYTKKGSQSKKAWKSNTAHFFYWGLEAPIWVPPKCAVVLLVDDFDFEIVS